MDTDTTKSTTNGVKKTTKNTKAKTTAPEEKAETTTTTTKEVTEEVEAPAEEDSKSKKTTKKTAAATKKTAGATKKKVTEEEEEEKVEEKETKKTTKSTAAATKKPTTATKKPSMTYKKKKLNEDGEEEEEKPKLSRTEELQMKLRKVDWTDLIPIGFEVKSLADMQKEEWSFQDLNQALKDGFLSKVDHPLYIFMGAQPIVEEKFALNIPYIVVFDCKSPPPEKICKASVQCGEEIFDMGIRFPLTWSPYIRSKLQNLDFSRTSKPIYALQWKKRTGQMPEDKLLELQYLLPYIRLPQIALEVPYIDVSQVNFKLAVSLDPKKIEEEKKRVNAHLKKREEEFAKGGNKFRITKAEKKAIDDELALLNDGRKLLEFTFDKAVDTMTAFTEEKQEDECLSDEGVEELKQALRDEFAKAREIKKKAHAAIKIEVDNMTEEMRENYRNAKVYKFYPSHPTLDVSMYSAKFVNRFFGDATQVFPKESVRDLTKLKLATKEELAAVHAEAEKERAEFEIKKKKYLEDMAKAKAEEEKENKKEDDKDVSKKRKAQKQEEEEAEEEEDEEEEEEEEKEEKEDKKKKSTKPAPKKTSNKKAAASSKKETEAKKVVKKSKK